FSAQNCFQENILVGRCTFPGESKAEVRDGNFAVLAREVIFSKVSDAAITVLPDEIDRRICPVLLGRLKN
ncbi:MAG TPA: hypothetical protein VNA66_10830, partial [Gammaproteobacteria bacterium]|nr:hypothetical protein [Gammaproteobacteria bacterium]